MRRSLLACGWRRRGCTGLVCAAWAPAMPEVAISRLTALQSRTSRVRNVCVVAHVDHGKTTLTDGLIASNGIIHPRLAGQLRYLDTREDEQARCITMKASSIALLYEREGQGAQHGGVEAAPGVQPPPPSSWLVNLIDSPGHVDFCSEVSAAVRLSDGAIVVVDVLEGVCIQTRSTLRQAWDEGLAMTLVLNKIDRLISELQLTPEEAYARIRRVVADVNLLIGTFRSEEYISRADALAMATAESDSESDSGEASGTGDRDRDADMSISIEDATLPEELLDDEDDEDYFSAERGNVAFASAYDGWAFRIEQFADMYAAKMGASRRALLKGLWGDRYYHPKSRRIVGRKQALKLANGRLKPMFAQLCLEPIWRVYAAAADNVPGRPALAALAAKMKLRVSTREFAKTDPTEAARAVMRSWLPLADAVLAAVVEVLPSPDVAAATRAPRLLGAASSAGRSQGLPDFPDDAPETRACIAAVGQCDTSDDVPTVAYVAKMVAVELADLPPRSAAAMVATAEAAEGSSDGPPQVFVAVARVFAGMLRSGTPLYVLNAAHDPQDADSVESAPRVGATELFLPMGRALEPVEAVPAGNLVAIAGLSSLVLKSATLASTPLARPLAPMVFPAAAIVRVAVEPADAADLPALSAGLRLLNQADPFVEVTQLPSGELVVGAAGEVHLERCIKDLQERFARVRISISAPLIAFRESLAAADSTRPPPPATALPAYWRGAAMPPEGAVAGAGMEWAAEVALGSGAARVRVRCARLPAAIAKAIDESKDELAATLGGDAGEAIVSTAAAEAVRERLVAAGRAVSADAADGTYNAESPDTMGLDPEALLARMWCLGPQSVGACVLLAPDDDAPSSTSVAEAGAEGRWVQLGCPVASERLGLHAGHSDTAAARQAPESELAALEAGVVAGFQAATAAGPLCNEPMWAVAFRVEACLSASGGADTPEDGGEPSDLSALSGQAISATKEALRAAVLASGPRLVEAVYIVECAARTDALGGSYAALSRRRGRVLREEMVEGADSFLILAHMPVAESFGFADELRTRTSGAASAMLMFSHWEAMGGEPVEADPLFVPLTEEEREELGEGGDAPTRNIARKLVDAARRRKGLPVEVKVVASATKQRTMARRK